MNRITFYSSTDMPHTQGRRAHEYYEPIAASFNRQGWQANIVHPSWIAHDNKVPRIAFTHLDAFLRWLDSDNTDVLCVWTCKDSDEFVARYARRLGLTVIYAELGWFPQAATIHFDTKGTGPQSSLVDWKPRLNLDAELVLAAPAHGDENKLCGIVGQLESDRNMQTSEFRYNGQLVEHLLRLWPEETFLFRPHPLQQDVHLPESPRVQVVRGGSLGDFFNSCWRIAGINSTALFESAAVGKPTYQFGRGPGHHSGAFVNPRTGLWCPQAASALISEMVDHRQIDIRQQLSTIEQVSRNAVLGPILRGENDNLRAVGGVCQEACR